MSDTRTDSQHKLVAASLTATEAAQRIGLSVEIVRTMCRAGTLTGAYRDKRSGRWRIPQDAVEAWINSNRHGKTRRTNLGYRGRMISGLVTIIALLGVISILADFGGAKQQVMEWGKELGILKDFPDASIGETLIVIATFHHTEGVPATDAPNKILKAIKNARDQLGIQNLRIEVESTRLLADDQTGAEKLGKRYNASIVIWGANTDVDSTVRFLNTREPNPVTIPSDTSPLANPSAYATFVTKDLREQLTFLALFAIGQSYYIKGAYADAARVIEKAIGAVPEATQLEGIPDAFFDLSWLYQVLDNPQQAIVNSTKAIELNPHYEEAFGNRGIARGAQGDLAGAIADFTKAIELKPNDAKAYYNRGNARRNLGDRAGALIDYDRAIELKPNDAEAYTNRGNVRRLQGDLLGAIVDLTKAIELRPDLAEAYHNRGIARMVQRDVPAAIADFSKAIYLRPDDAATYYFRGNARSQIGDLPGAIADFSKAIELKPDLAEAYSHRGNLRSQKSDLPGTIADYSKAIELKPDFAEAYANRAGSYALQGNLVGAIADYSKAIDLKVEPNLAEVYDGRGVVRGLQGDLAGAIADFSKAIDLKPDLAEAYQLRGVARGQQGDLAGAISDLRRYLELLPDASDRSEVEDMIVKLQKRLSAP